MPEAVRVETPNYDYYYLCTDLRQKRMAHATEIVLQLGRTGLPWAEHPVHIVYTDYSRAKGQSLMNSVNILVDTILK